WFKMQKARDAVFRRPGGPVGRFLRDRMLGAIGGDPARRPAPFPIGGVRTAQQELYDVLGTTRPLLYADSLWEHLGDYSAYADLDVDRERIKRWHPLNCSLYVGYKLMLPGLLLFGKGDRIAMHSSVEARYPFLDDDVINFCASVDPGYKLR